VSLSYYYEFTAPASVAADELETFLRGVEQDARSLGFEPVTVLNVPFDTPERQAFSRRLGASLTVQDERLKGVALPARDLIRDHDPVAGECRVFPEHGVVLVVTDERGCETCFGFFHFPQHVHDIHGHVLAESGLEGAWLFRDFVDSPDPRFRQIVRQFAEGGFLKHEKDEFAAPPEQSGS
jgi:hypothetical protein